MTHTLLLIVGSVVCLASVGYLARVIARNRMAEHYRRAAELRAGLEELRARRVAGGIYVEPVRRKSSTVGFEGASEADIAEKLSQSTIDDHGGVRWNRQH